MRHRADLARLAFAAFMVGAALLLEHRAAAPPVTALAPPPSSIFGFRAVWFVESSYAGEDGLIGYRSPIGDWDYGTGYDVSRHIRLPGTSANLYTFFGSVYVYGSGWVQEYGTPDGRGRFALLHLRNSYGGPLRAIPAYCGAPAGSPGIDATALAVAALPPPRASSERVRGGSYIGWSGYPYCPQYALGVPGAGNSHLCLVTDYIAARWFSLVAAGDEPKPFPVARWNHYRHIPYRRHGRLTWAASVWWGHSARLGGITRPEVWHGPRRHRRYGYEQDTFAHGAIFLWPRTHAVKITYRR